MILTFNEALGELIENNELDKIQALKDKYDLPFEVKWVQYPNMEGDMIDYLKVGSWNTNFHILQEVVSGEQRMITLIDEFTMTQIDLKVENGFFWINDDKVIETAGQFIDDLNRKQIRVYKHSEIPE